MTFRGQLGPVRGNLDFYMEVLLQTDKKKKQNVVDTFLDYIQKPLD